MSEQAAHFSSRALEFFFGTWALEGKREGQESFCTVVFYQITFPALQHVAYFPSYTCGVKLLYVANSPVLRFSCCVPTAVIGRAMTQTFSRRPLTAAAWVRALVSPCGICGGQSGTGTGFFRVLPVSPVSISPPWATLFGKLKK
jgi:hypothetical protein